MSRWASGLTVRRPMAEGVGSPRLSDIAAWAYSWRERAIRRAGTRKRSVEKLRKSDMETPLKRIAVSGRTGRMAEKRRFYRGHYTIYKEILSHGKQTGDAFPGKLSFYAEQSILGNRFGPGIRKRRERFTGFAPSGTGSLFSGRRCPGFSFGKLLFPGRSLFLRPPLFFGGFRRSREAGSMVLLSGRAAVRRPPDFCLSEKGNFFDGKVRLFLDRKGMNLYTG